MDACFHVSPYKNDVYVLYIYVYVLSLNTLPVGICMEIYHIKH